MENDYTIQPVYMFLSLLVIIGIIFIFVVNMARFRKNKKVFVLDEEAIKEKDLLNLGFKCIKKTFYGCNKYILNKWIINYDLKYLTYSLTHENIKSLNYTIMTFHNKKDLNNFVEFINK